MWFRDVAAAVRVYGDPALLTFLYVTFDHLYAMTHCVRRRPQRIQHPRRSGRSRQHPGVADLPAALAVERSHVEDRLSRLSSLELRHSLLSVDQSHDLGIVAANGIIAYELHRGACQRSCVLCRDLSCVPDRASRLSRPGSLLVHQKGETVVVYGHPVFRRDLLCEFQRESIGVVQPEGNISRQFSSPAFSECRYLVPQDRHP